MVVEEVEDRQGCRAQGHVNEVWLEECTHSDLHHQCQLGVSIEVAVSATRASHSAAEIVQEEGGEKEKEKACVMVAKGVQVVEVVMMMSVAMESREEMRAEMALMISTAETDSSESQADQTAEDLLPHPA